MSQELKLQVTEGKTKNGLPKIIEVVKLNGSNATVIIELYEIKYR
jgi:hypothetical protein